jgi:mannitol-specific phosphotransferase system IIBC component
LNNDLIYLKGSIPGSKNTLVFLRNSVKKINIKTILKKNKIVDKQDKKPEKTIVTKEKITTKVEQKKEEILKKVEKKDIKNE